jgi:hypothetical protein
MPRRVPGNQLAIRHFSPPAAGDDRQHRLARQRGRRLSGALLGRKIRRIRFTQALAREGVDKGIG